MGIGRATATTTVTTTATPTARGTATPTAKGARPMPRRCGAEVDTTSAPAQRRAGGVARTAGLRARVLGGWVGLLLGCSAGAPAPAVRVAAPMEAALPGIVDAGARASAASRGAWVAGRVAARAPGIEEDLALARASRRVVTCDPAFLEAIVRDAASQVPALAQGDLASWIDEHRLEVVVAAASAEGGLRRWRVGADEATYFYPASLVKPFVAAVALVDAHAHGVTLDTPLRIAPLEVSWAGEVVRVGDGAAGVTLRDLVRDSLLVSDNGAYNRLFDVVGRDRLNRAAAAWGYDSFRLHARFAALSREPEVQAHAPRVERRRDGAWEVWREASRAEDAPRAIAQPGVEVGVAWIDADRSRQEGPMSFATHNAAALDDLVRWMVNLVEPELDGDAGDLPLEDDARAWLIASMTDRPPPRGPMDAEARRAQFRPLETGASRALGGLDAVRVTSKVGYSYGFFGDVARIESVANGRAVHVGVVIYANANGVLNDGRYEVDRVARPFVEAVGERVTAGFLRARPSGESHDGGAQVPGDFPGNLDQFCTAPLAQGGERYTVRHH